MRVAWDLQAVTGPGRTGLGVSVQFMLDALRDHAPDISLVELRPNEKGQALRGVRDRLGWEQQRYPRMLRAEHRRKPLDLAYSPALGAPLKAPVPVIAHVHDLIPIIYPKQFSGVAGWYWRTLLPKTWRACRALTVSNQTVADDIAYRLGYPRERIHIVCYYPDPELARMAKASHPDYAQVSDSEPISEPLFVTLASHEPRKNLELAIRGLAGLKWAGVKARLVLVGGTTPHTEELQRVAEALDVSAQIGMPGYLNRHAIVQLLLECTALLFTSRYEGFGMPPLEAMSIGVPAILSGIPCHRRIYNDQQRTAIVGSTWEPPPFVGVDDAEALTKVMGRIAADAAWRASLRRSGLAYSATFTPEATAAGLRAAFVSALGR